MSDKMVFIPSKEEGETRKIRNLPVFSRKGELLSVSEEQADEIVNAIPGAYAVGAGGGGGGGGGGGMIVTLTRVGDSDTNFTADKSLSEIIAARNAGTPVWIESAGLMLPVTNVIDDEQYPMAFAMSLLDVNEGRFAALMLACSDGDKAWTGNGYEYQVSQTPEIPFTLSVDGKGDFEATTEYSYSDVSQLYYNSHSILAEGTLAGAATVLLPLTEVGSDFFMFAGAIRYNNAYGIAAIWLYANDQANATFVPMS